jgi:hypothetical protein
MTQPRMTACLADEICISKRKAKPALDELNELASRQLKMRVRFAWRVSESSVRASSMHAWARNPTAASRSRFERRPVYGPRRH